MSILLLHKPYFVKWSTKGGDGVKMPKNMSTWFMDDNLTGFFFSILQGTIWYSILKFKPMLKIAKMMNYTAMGVGNHDLGAVDVFILSNLLDRD